MMTTYDLGAFGDMCIIRSIQLLYGIHLGEGIAQV